MNDCLINITSTIYFMNIILNAFDRFYYGFCLMIVVLYYQWQGINK